MKKLILLAVVMICSAVGAYAQGYIFIDSEKVFKSQADYNRAIQELENMTTTAEKTISDEFDAIETLYNNYQTQKAYLSESNRTAREDEIISRERKINEYQDNMFGEEGQLMKARLEKIKPIQERIFAAINAYAEKNGHTMVIDVVNNATLLYYSPALDKTEDIINILK